MLIVPWCHRQETAKKVISQSNTIGQLYANHYCTFITINTNIRTNVSSNCNTTQLTEITLVQSGILHIRCKQNIFKII